MLKAVITTILIVICVLPVYSQTSFNIFAGYGQSDFEDIEEQAGYIPAGVQLLFGDQIQFGGEFNYAVVPFEFEFQEGGQDIGEIKVNQMVIGGLVRFNFGAGDVIPYLRGGAGLYSGDQEISFSDENLQGFEGGSFTVEMEDEFGFNVGGGVSFGGVFVEVVYHIVDRKPKDSDIDGIKMNNFALQAGLQFQL